MHRYPIPNNYKVNRHFIAGNNNRKFLRHTDQRPKERL